MTRSGGYSDCMKLAWLTDIHLNFLEPNEVESFLQTVAQTPCDGMLLSGDIGEAPDVAYYLQSLDTPFQKPIYFVHGNHDFYGGSMAAVRENIGYLHDRRSNLHYLPRSSVVALTE